MSPKDPFSTADLESTPAEFTCSRGTRGEVKPAAERLERHPVDALPPNADHDSVPRRLYLKQRDFMAYGTSDNCPGCRALVSGGCAQGHTEECRIRVQNELRKTEEGKARLHAAAIRVSDAPTGRALMRVRFAADRVVDDAETPEATSVSASSSLPADAAMSNSLPAPSSEPGLSASADDMPDQVMSEGASSSPDAPVRFRMKRTSDDNSNSESATKRLHIDHSTRDVVMLLDGSDVGHAVGQSVMEKESSLLTCMTGTVNPEIACALSVQMVQLLLAPVVRPPGELMTNESRLLDVLASEQVVG